MDTNNVTASGGLSLSSIGIIVGIILCVLQGVGTINIGWFWATFPFWIVPAVSLALLLICAVIALVMYLVSDGR